MNFWTDTGAGWYVPIESPIFGECRLEIWPTPGPFTLAGDPVEAAFVAAILVGGIPRRTQPLEADNIDDAKQEAAQWGLRGSEQKVTADPEPENTCGLSCTGCDVCLDLSFLNDAQGG